MVAGEVYDAIHPYLLERLRQTRRMLHKLNNCDPDDEEQQKHLLRSILGKTGTDFHFNLPFRCDYGSNIEIGEGFFANFNLTILDEAKVRIGRDVFIGPNVSIFTACHPTDPEARRTRQEWAREVNIGNDVWIGGGAVLLPGCSIGDGCTIGAGAVVHGNIPARSVAAGNPAKVIKTV